MSEEEKIELHYDTLEEYEVQLTEQRYRARTFRNAVIEKEQRIRQLEKALKSAIELIKQKDKDFEEAKDEYLLLRDRIDKVRKQYPSSAELMYHGGYRYHLPVQDPTKLSEIIAVGAYFLPKPQ